jgi:hypothetical protein
MRIRRDISSIPVQSASETWKQIVALITAKGTVDEQQLSAANGVLASLITDEHPAARAIIVEGVGPQLRLYCRYGMSAIEEGGAVTALNWNPTAGDWSMHVPCDAENLSWVRNSLAKTSPRIKVFDVAEAERSENDSATAERANESIQVNWDL